MAELISPMSMLLYAINFIILFVVVRHFLYKPVTAFIDARQQRMQAAREEIEKGRTEIDEIRRNQHADYEKLISKGEMEVNERLSRADEDAKSILSAAQGDADQIVANARQAADEETAKARVELREEIKALSVQLSSRILEREVKADDHKMLIDEFLDKVG